jgi:hypothetical protein
MQRDLSAVDTASAKATGSDVIVQGNPDAWRLVYKTWLSDNSAMFSINHHVQLGLVQFSWNVGGEVCEQLVDIGTTTLGARPAPCSPDGYYPIVKPHGGWNGSVEAKQAGSPSGQFYHALECSAESASLGFRKATLLFYTTHGAPSVGYQAGRGGIITLVMTEERGKIAMAASISYV